MIALRLKKALIVPSICDRAQMNVSEKKLPRAQVIVRNLAPEFENDISLGELSILIQRCPARTCNAMPGSSVFSCWPERLLAQQGKIYLIGNWQGMTRSKVFAVRC